MKLMISRLVSLFCSIFVAIYMVIPCFALSGGFIENRNGQVISEYDYIVSIRKMTERELKNVDLPMVEKQKIRSNAVENEILNRKKLSDQVLALQYGYNDKEIAILRKYNGGRLEDHAELKAITGTLTIAKPNIVTSSGSAFKLTVKWSWDHCPIVQAKDVFAIAWKPTFGKENGNLRLVTSKSSHKVTYSLIDGTTKTYNKSIKNVTPCATAKSEFQMNGDRIIHYNGGVDVVEWASEGKLTLYFETTYGSAFMTAIDMVFGYGHTYIGASPSVSFDSSGTAGIGISFGWNTSEADVRSGYVTIGSSFWHDT